MSENPNRYIWLTSSLTPVIPFRVLVWNHRCRRGNQKTVHFNFFLLVSRKHHVDFFPFEYMLKKTKFRCFPCLLKKSRILACMRRTWLLANKARQKVSRMGWEGISPSAPEWTGRDLNSRAQPKLPYFPRPPRCQRGDHTRLIYQPSATHSTNKNNLSVLPLRKCESLCIKNPSSVTF